MNKLTVLELMEIKTLLRIAGEDYKEHIKNWYDNGFNKQFRAPVWEEYYAKCTYLYDRLEEVIAEELND